MALKQSVFILIHKSGVGKSRSILLRGPFSDTGMG